VRSAVVGDRDRKVVHPANDRPALVYSMPSGADPVV
jgi:hypothetical protein